MASPRSRSTLPGSNQPGVMRQSLGGGGRHPCLPVWFAGMGSVATAKATARSACRSIAVLCPSRSETGTPPLRRCGDSTSRRCWMTSAHRWSGTSEPEQRWDCTGGCRRIMRDRPSAGQSGASALPSPERICSVAVRAAAVTGLRPGMGYDQRSPSVMPITAECAGGGRRSGSRTRHRRSIRTSRGIAGNCPLPAAQGAGSRPGETSGNPRFAVQARLVRACQDGRSACGSGRPVLRRV